MNCRIKRSQEWFPHDRNDRNDRDRCDCERCDTWFSLATQAQARATYASENQALQRRTFKHRIV